MTEGELKMRRRTALLGGLTVGLLIAGCGGSTTSSGQPASSSAPSSSTASTRATVQLGNSNLGSVVVDDRGLAVYTLSSDKTGSSSCTGSCASVWPPVTVAAGTKPGAGQGVTGTLAVIKRADGTEQVTIAGHPLYRYTGDTATGQVNGQGIKSFGGTWYAVTATGTPASSGSAPSSSPTKGDGGYQY
jgi:predicted lipoprotein with Yx(FWY)xxD motif